MIYLLDNILYPNMDAVRNKSAEINITLTRMINSDGIKVNDQLPNVDMLNEVLAKRLIASEIKSFGDKMYKEAGNNLEYLAQSCGINTIVLPGNTSTLYNNGILKLKKSVRNPVQKVNTDQLLNFLRQAGVQEELLQQAKAAATTSNKPAVYLTVESSFK